MSDDDYLRLIGQKLKSIRESKNLSQVEVCAKLKMDKTYLSSIENGRQNPSLITIKNILQAMGETRVVLDLTASESLAGDSEVE